MRLEIKYKRVEPSLEPLAPLAKGEWIDLRLAEDIHLSEGEFTLLPLGIRMCLPEGYEAWIVPRSSTFKEFGILQVNSIGIIDSSYCGPNDIWKMPVCATKAVAIQKGTRICQFRIMPSMKATAMVKQDWTLYQGVDFVEKDWIALDRGGFGSTGIR